MDGQAKRLLDAGTAVISDVIDAMGHLPLVLDTALAQLDGAARPFAGPAYTISGESLRRSGGGDRTKLAAIDAMQPECVAVWAGTDIRGVCCFGDLLGAAMLARGCAGAIVDGGVRDVAYLRQLALPIMARYRTPAQAIGRWRVTGVQVPVIVRGALEDRITIHPGDVVVADDDGAIVVPRDELGEVARRVGIWSATEDDARSDVLKGMPLLTALEKYGHL
jgi:regulator of RNase E activity RraA